MKLENNGMRSETATGTAPDTGTPGYRDAAPAANARAPRISVPDPRPNAPVPTDRVSPGNDATAPGPQEMAAARQDGSGTARAPNPAANGAPASGARPSQTVPVPGIERDRDDADFETAEAHGDEREDAPSGDYGTAADGPHDSIPVPADTPEGIEPSIDFTEVEIAEEFSEPLTAVTPGGVLPMEPSPVEGRLRKAPLRVPEELEECGGFTLFGRRIRSLLYTTDVAVIRNSNADAVFAVYPFTAQPAITQALLTVSEAPVFVGVGGGTTTGKRAVQLAAVSEMQGAAGVIVNSPAPPEMIESIATVIDIPVIATVVRCDAVAHAKVKAGAKILNVAAGKDTPMVLRELRETYPNLPLIASGGRSSLSVRETVQAGANAVIWTPPSAQQLQADMMRRYRSTEEKPAVPVMDPVAAADVNPLESARADIPLPDELIAKATSLPRRKGGFPPLSFFSKGKRR